MSSISWLVFFYVYFYINFYNVDLFMMLKIVLEALSTLHLSARSALTISISLPSIH